MKHYYGENQGDMGYGEGTDMGCQEENRQNMGYQTGYGQETGHETEYEQQIRNQGQGAFVEAKEKKEKKKKKEKRKTNAATILYVSNKYDYMEL